MSIRSTLTWVDVGLRERVTIISSAAGIGATLPALQVLSNASLTTHHDGTLSPTGLPTPAAATWPERGNMMVLSCSDASQHRIQIFIPAPLASLMLADRINYDGTQAPWLTLAGDLPGLSIPFSGLPITTLLSATMAFRGEGLWESANNFNMGFSWLRRTVLWRDSFGNSVLTHLAGLTTGSPPLSTILA